MNDSFRTYAATRSPTCVCPGWENWPVCEIPRGISISKSDASDQSNGTGEVAVSLGTIGTVAALTFSGILEMQIAGTLLGAHVGYHAAASKRR
jgi:hypothetical protein